MIYWIMGGTAVGKKTYIHHLGRSGFGEPFWMGDQDRLLIEVVEAGKAGGVMLARWQWAREHVIANVAEASPEVDQRLVLLTARPEVQLARANKREPDRWYESNLTGEALSVRLVALGLASAYGLPLVEVDISSDDTSDWKPPQ